VAWCFIFGSLREGEWQELQKKLQGKKEGSSGLEVLDAGAALLVEDPVSAIGAADIDIDFHFVLATGTLVRAGHPVIPPSVE
jgi:hypothetical protein